MTAKPKILFVLSSCNNFDKGGKPHPTGWYLPEAAHPYYELVDAADIVFASPKGGKAPLDPGSVEAFKEDPVSQKFLEARLWENTEKLSSISADQFQAIVFVGGHAPVFDLVDNEASQKLAREFYESNKVIAAVCHGPIALAKVKLSDGSYLIAGEKVTGLSVAEEDSIGFSPYMPVMLEELLKKNGGIYEKADKNWGEKVCISKGGKLITAQNPLSAAAMGKAILKSIS